MPKKHKKTLEEKQVDLTTEAKKIIEHVQAICHLGSTNKDDKKLAFSAFRNLIVAIHYVLNYQKHSAIGNKLSADDKALIAKLSGKTIEMPTSTLEIPLKGHDSLTCLNFADILASNILTVVFNLYPATKFNNWSSFKKLDITIVWYLHALAKHASILNLTKQPVEFTKQSNDEQRYNTWLSEGKPKHHTIKEQLFFLTQTLKYTKEISVAYSFGNCSHMADLVLLAALRDNLPCTITYVRFNNKQNPQAEELYTVIFGDWPQKGCLVISPWLNKEKVFAWQGSVVATPQLCEMDYNNYTITFSVAKKDKTKKAFADLIVKSGYDDWQNVPERLANSEEASQFYAAFVDQLLTLGQLPFSISSLLSSSSVSFWQTIPKNVIDLVEEYLGENGLQCEEKSNSLTL